MDNISLNKKNTLNIYLYIYLFYIIFATISSNTSYSMYLNGLYKIGYFLLIGINLFYLFMLKNKDGNKCISDYFVAIAILLILSLRIIFDIRIIPMELIPIYLFIVNLKYINIHKLINKDFKVKIYIFIIIIGLFLCHLTPDFDLILHRHGFIRISAGFGNVNIFSSIALCLIYSYILFLGKKIYKDSSILTIFIVCIILFYFTDTRGFIVSSLALPILIFFGKEKTCRYIIEYLSIIFILIVSIISVVIPITVSTTSSFFYYFNGLLANRLSIQHFVTTIYPVKFFGYKNNIISWLTSYNGGIKVFIDNTYLILLISGGIIGFFIFEFIFLKACYISIKYDVYVLCVIFISLSLLFITEDIQNYIFMYVPIICAYNINYLNKYKRRKIINKQFLK